MGRTDADIGPGAARALRGATLALIVERGTYGYALAHRLNARLGPGWRIEPKQLYPILDQLERAGLVTRAEETVSGRSRQRRIVYRATDRAPAAVRRWMDSPVHKEPLRPEIEARLSSASPSDAGRLLQMLDEYEIEVISLIEATDDGGAAASARGWAKLKRDGLRDRADAHLRAELAWVAAMRRRIRECPESRL